MSTVAQAKFYHFIYKLFAAVVTIFFIALLATVFSPQVKSIVENLTPPQPPQLQVLTPQGEWLEQDWSDQNWGGSQHQISDEARKYHHISQGTRTLPIPYEWFISLEQPSSSLWSFFLKNTFFKNKKFIDNRYLLRFGFIRSEPDPDHNPDGLPIGFAKSPSITLPGYATQTAGIGFTCAACHTGHFIYGEGKEKHEYVIEGAPATTDLTLFTKAIAAALGQTALSSKIPFLDGRFDRFAKNVLGKQYNATTKLALAQNLANIISAGQKTSDIIDVDEGFTRLDALNRIGNQVFSKNLDRRENYQPINAPVNYPHIWTSSWFNWVQYDGSIMGPLIRNAGEAMGVNADVDTTSPLNENRFGSSIDMFNLVWIERFLRGNPPDETNGFSGLKAPVWTITKIDHEKAEQGKALYRKICQGCHLPALNDPEIWQQRYFSTIKYRENGLPKETKDKTLKLHVIPIAQVGTDPAQAEVLVSRTLNTAGRGDGTVGENTPGVGIDKIICGPDPNQVQALQLEDTYAYDEIGRFDTAVYKIPYYENKLNLVDISVRDGGEISYGLALGAIVNQTIDTWFKLNGISDENLRAEMEDGRPNCIRATLGYKARPLNGVWATAPFLHNGSVATLKDLLCPDGGVRPTYVQLGKIDFDPVNVGIKQPENFSERARKYLRRGKVYTKEGYFILDTTKPGNRNSGHYFSDAYDKNTGFMEQKKGVIGGKFTPAQCEAIIEYLKTI